MIGDPWPEEPDEDLVEKYRSGSPEEELAPGEELTPEEELVPDVDPDEVPPDLMRAFWSLVATINVGLFATSLGLMLIGFRGEWRDGGLVLLLGVAVLALAGHRYRRYQRDDHTWGEDEDTADSDTDSDSGTDDRND